MVFDKGRERSWNSATGDEVNKISGIFTVEFATTPITGHRVQNKNEAKDLTTQTQDHDEASSDVMSQVMTSSVIMPTTPASSTVTPVAVEWTSPSSKES